MTIKILGVKINLNKKKEVLEEIKKYLILDKRQQEIGHKNDIKPFVIFTPNPEIINYAQKDVLFKQIVNSAQINIPDGVGLCLAIKKKFNIKTDRLSGTDLMMDICNLSAKKRFTIGLIGGRRGVALETKECLSRDYPNLKIEVLEAPEIQVACSKFKVARITKIIPNTKYIILNTEGKQDNKTEKYFQNLANVILSRRIDILFVALGYPKQEYFIKNFKFQISNFKYNRPLVMMGVGGAFDYISGRVERASYWLREKGLEWLYRLVREPWRIKRQLAGLSFFWHILINQEKN